MYLVILLKGNKVYHAFQIYLTIYLLLRAAPGKKYTMEYTSEMLTPLFLGENFKIPGMW